MTEPRTTDIAGVIESTPAFVYDQSRLLKSADSVARTCRSSGCKTLYAVKALSLSQILSLMLRRLDGLSVSSLFEAYLGKQASSHSVSMHFTSPCVRAEEIHLLADLCDYISFNSLTQWNRFAPMVGDRVSCGLRVNPQLSFLSDPRYDPCRRYSKLGVPVQALKEIVRNEPHLLREVRGLHFHTNCDSPDFSQLLATVQHLDALVPGLLNSIDWVNLGGGYLFCEAENISEFSKAVRLLQSKHGLSVFVEPGATLVREGVFLVSSVVDLFRNDGKMIAVLDTTVNHWPEIFEYQFQPDVIGHVEGARHEYVLAGGSCLAGDLFGEYSFTEPLEIGSRIVIANAGAYSLVKASMFNGINLPHVYALTETGQLTLQRRFTYRDFASRFGSERYVADGTRVRNLSVAW